MRIPIVRGTIDRRILVNFRVDPDRLAALLPAPFRPQLVAGYGMAGICLIRLKHLRPRWLPAAVGIGSENAAHRIAVEWEFAGQLQNGVYIPRRDTSSLLNTLAGGRIFPGEHHRASFDVMETDDSCRVAMRSQDGSAQVLVDGHLADKLPNNSVFNSVAAASEFFECGSIGCSPASRHELFDVLELRSFNWQVQPLAIDRVESSYFDNQELFPKGTAAFDHALLMRGINHEWHSHDALFASSP